VAEGRLDIRVAIPCDAERRPVKGGSSVYRRGGGRVYQAAPG
jgi:hypothetical protein